MPAAAIIVPAVAAVAGGVIQHKTASNANKAQQKATDSALAYQRERNAIEDKRYDSQASTEQQRYDQRWQAYQAYVSDYQRRHGGGGAGAVSAPNMSPVAVNARAAVMGQQSPGGLGPTVPGATSQGMTLRDMASGAMPTMPGATAAAGAVPPPEVSSMQPAPPMGQPRTLREIAGQWNQWDPYLHGQA